MTQPFVSVVMPVYNAAAHLPSAIDSILSQTFGAFELILVNDKSIDGCAEICDGYAAADPRVRVIHKPANEGAGEARNTGMDAAEGHYIWFVDSDDRVESDVIETVHRSVTEHAAQVVAFGCVEEYFDRNRKLHHSVTICPEECTATGIESVRRCVMPLEEITLYGYVWNKFYSLELVRKSGVRFRKMKLNEDFFFNVELFMTVESMNILAVSPYYYAKRMESSLTAGFIAEYFQIHEQSVRALYDQHREWGMLEDATSQKIANIYVRYIFSAIQRNFDPRSGMNTDARKRFLTDLFDAELYNTLIPFAKSDNRMLKPLISALKNRNVGRALRFGRIIYIVKSKLPIVFSVLKQNR